VGYAGVVTFHGTPGIPFEPPQSLNRILLLERLDWRSSNGRTRSSLRLAGQMVSRPDFIWSPYSAYTSGMELPAGGTAANITTASSNGKSLTHLLLAWNYVEVAWQRAQPNTPTLVVTGGNEGLLPVLPGSLAAYGLDNRNRTLKVSDDSVFVMGRHIFKAGGGFLLRQLSDLLDYGAGGEYSFPNIVSFGLDQPALFTAALSRTAPYYRQPDMHRAYRENQFSAFVHDIYRAGPRLVINYGIRYENFGGPVATGAHYDPLVQFGSGETVDQRIAAAQLVSRKQGASLSWGKPVIRSARRVCLGCSAQRRDCHPRRVRHILRSNFRQPVAQSEKQQLCVPACISGCVQ
jgi:hypothetical protein